MNKENASKLWKIIQEAMLAINAIDIGLPIEFVNFRD